MQGYGFAGDERIAEERKALEEEIKRAKEVAECRRERYIREKASQMLDNGLHELWRNVNKVDIKKRKDVK